MSAVSMNTQASALYIPVHKRSASRGDASSISSTDSRSATPTSQHESSIESPHLPVYSIQDMLLLSKSPLVAFSPNHRDHLKDTVPEIVLNRKQRKVIEHRQHDKVHPSGQMPEESDREPLSPMWNSVQRRTVRQGRVQRNMKNLKIVEELSWRVPRTRSISAAGSPLLLVPATA